MPATLGSRGSDPWEAALLPGYVTRVSLNYKLQFLLLLARDIDPDKQKEAELPLYHAGGVGRRHMEPTWFTSVPLGTPYEWVQQPQPEKVMIILTGEKMQKIFSPKVETYVLFGKLWGLQDQEAASQTALRDCSEEGGEEPGHTGVLQPKPDNQNIKTSLFIKENQTSS